MPASVDSTRPEQRIVEAAALLPVGGAVTGWAALRLAGASYFDGLTRDADPRAVPLATGPGQARRARTGVSWSQDRLDPEDVWRLHGVPCTRPARALFDEMRSLADVRARVVAADMAFAAELVSIRRMLAYLERRRRWVGVGRARAALQLADEHSRSPGESRLRMAWTVGAGRSRPLCNRDVFDEGRRLLGVADLIDPEAGVVGEYDGAEHARARRRSRDAERDSTFRDHGLEVFRVTAWDERDPGVVRDRIHAAYERARLGTAPRRWTLRPPTGWERPLSLDDHLDLNDVMRDFHARNED